QIDLGVQQMAVLEVDGAEVAMPLGVGSLTEDDDRDVGPALVDTIDTQGRRTAGASYGRADAGEDRGGPGKICVGIACALPGDRPATRSHPAIIGRARGDQHIAVGAPRPSAARLPEA